MIVFSNPGVLDVRGITVFGLSAKDVSKNPLGRFGTGIKFGIAAVLRMGGAVTIQAGLTTYTFGVRADTMRGKEFQQIQMFSTRPPTEEELRVNPGAHAVTEGGDLAFTTDLGKDWKAWQAYREFYCNSVTDEGGRVEDMPDETPIGVSPDWTVIEVRGEFFEMEHRKRHQFILEPDRVPRFVVPDVIEVYDGHSEAVFYRGIKVADIPKDGARYTYNLIGYTYLTEDRTLLMMSQFTGAVAQAVTSGLDEDFTRDVLSIVDDRGDDRSGIEVQLDYEGKELTSRLYSIAKEIIDKTKGAINRSIGWGVTRYEKENLLSRRIDLTPAEQAELANAIMRCTVAGLMMGHDREAYTIAVVADLGAGETVHRDDDKKAILLSVDLLDDPEALMIAVAGEMLGIEFGHSVGTAEFCNRLVGKFVRTVGASTSPVAVPEPTPETVAPVKPDTVYVLIGEWSGYRDSQRKVVHREILELAQGERYKNLRSIVYTDGTTLDVSLVETPRADTIGMTLRLSYNSLLSKAATSGKSHFRIGVDDAAKESRITPASEAEEPPEPAEAPVEEPEPVVHDQTDGV